MSDHQEQHRLEASPALDSTYLPADNPLEPPESQRLPAGGAMEERGGTRNESQKCCCAPSLRSVLMDSTDHCCCFQLCALMYISCICCCVFNFPHRDNDSTV